MNSCGLVILGDRSKLVHRGGHGAIEKRLIISYRDLQNI